MSNNSAYDKRILFDGVLQIILLGRKIYFEDITILFMDKNFNQCSHGLKITELLMLCKRISAWCASHHEPPAFNKLLVHSSCHEYSLFWIWKITWALLPPHPVEIQESLVTLKILKETRNSFKEWPEPLMNFKQNHYRSWKYYKSCYF